MLYKTNKKKCKEQNEIYIVHSHELGCSNAIAGSFFRLRSISVLKNYIANNIY